MKNEYPTDPMDISIVIPIFEEEDNIIPLYEKIVDTLEPLKVRFEMIMVDDGSRDKSYQKMQEIHQRDKRLVAVLFRKNYGQTAAMDAGFKLAKGNIIIAMDGDLQNDPADIPRLLAKIDEGYDVVSGWRKNRKDTARKNFVSRGAYLLRQVILRDGVHDSGCSLKAYKKECFDNLDLHGEMHRFIVALLQWQGFTVGEIEVTHHPRLHGRSKYNVKRIIKGFLDMLVVSFWMRFSTRPIHVFGALGIVTGISGFLCALYSAIIKLVYDQDLTDTFLPFLALILIILGVQFIISGLLADISIKHYFKDRKYYHIKTILKDKSEE